MGFRKHRHSAVTKPPASTPVSIGSTPYSLARLNQPRIQRSPIKTNFGTFKDEMYKVRQVEGYDSSVLFYLKFMPGANVDARQIGLVQMVKDVDSKGTRYIDPGTRKRSSNGWAIDQDSSNPNPVYFTNTPPKNAKRRRNMGDWKDSNKIKANKEADIKKGSDPYDGLGQYGYRYKKGSSVQSKNAELWDSPTTFNRNPGFKMIFETAAFAVSGKQKGQWYGSVTWGAQREKTGKLKLFPFAKGGDALPSKQFIKTAKKWNESKTQGTLSIAWPKVDAVNFVTSVIPGWKGPKGMFSVSEWLFELKKGDKVKFLSPFSHKNKMYFKIKVDASHPKLANKVAYVPAESIKDAGDGKDTLDLPIPGESSQPSSRPSSQPASRPTSRPN